MRIPAVGLAASLVGITAAGDDDCPPLFDHETLARAAIEEVVGRSLGGETRYRVKRITVIRQNVFNPDDPAESNAAFRFANRWHANTREGVIRELLLFREGDAVSGDVVAESERLLRAKPYLYDARVVADRLCEVANATTGDGLVEVDLVVVTRDVWSLSPELSVTRTGGEHRVRVGVSEINLAGTGAHFDFTVFDNPDREGVSLSYADANLGTSRVGYKLRYDDTDDGDQVEARIGQPFYAFDARRAWHAGYHRAKTLQGLYDAGERIGEFARDYRLAQIWTGWSKGRQDGWVNRLSTGVTLEDWHLMPGVDSDLVLTSRRFLYPWIALQRIQDDYAQARNVDRVQTTEDVYLGRRYDALFGYFPRGDGHVVARAEFRDGLLRGDDGILRYGVRASGYWNTTDRRAENVVARAWARYRHRQSPRLAMILDAETTLTDGLSADQQVLIGGSSGLRGYPNRYQAGTRQFRLSAEERYYTNLYPLRVLRVALAGFVDVGRAWSSANDNDTLVNAGVGLRLESTRTNRNLVYHIDVAFPVVDGPGVRGVEVTLTSKRSL